MAAKKLLDLLASALPDGILIEELYSCASQEMWQKDERLAAEEALKNCDRINWQAYGANYPDVAQAGFRPWTHFINHGIFEGRKLFATNPRIKENSSAASGNPKVSVIISPGSRALLVASIDSALNQSLGSIEIIVPLDIGNAENEEFAGKLTELDSRIVISPVSQDSEMHGSRRQAVELARGQYVIFLEAGDELAASACEIAFSTALRGYDSVFFNMDAKFRDGADKVKGRELVKKVNLSKNREWKGSELLKAVFMDKNMNYEVWNRLYSAGLCKAAFAEMEGANISGDPDLYEFLALSRKINIAIKINDILYYKNFYPLSREDMKNNPRYGTTMLPAIHDYCRTYDLNIFERYIDNMLLDKLVEDFACLENSPEVVTAFLDNAIKNFGIKAVISKFLNSRFREWGRVGDIFCNYQPAYASESPTRIGIFYHRLSFGGVETNIAVLCDLLIKNGYEVCLFLEEKSENDFALNAGVKVYYINNSEYTPENIQKHVSAFHDVLEESGINLMLYFAWLSPALLWDTMLLHLLGIPVIVCMRGCFSFCLVDRKIDYTHQQCLSVYKCVDKFLCLSVFTEKYFRAQGLDVTYIPNPVPEQNFRPDNEGRSNNIIFLARLDDNLKRINQALYVLKEVVKNVPDAKLYVIGGSSNEARLSKFYGLATQLGMLDNLVMIGWSDNPQKYMDKAKVLFGASWCEGFPNGIAEAQAHGLPCVIYELPVMIAEDNPGIIQVPPGDYVEAAEQITRLMENEAEWRKRSEMALESIKRFAPDKYAGEIMDFLKNYRQQSRVTEFSASHYNKIIKTMLRCAGNVIPAD